MQDKDKLTTILGAVGAVVTAAEPVVSASSGTMHQGDWLQLAMAVVFGLLGWATNKKEAKIISTD